MKTHKKLYLSIGISGIAVLLVGFVALALGIIGDPQLSEQATLLLKIFGSCGAIIGIISITFGGYNFFKRHKAFIIEENDERNVAIRGKAASLTNVITVVLLFIVEIICLAMEIFVAALLIIAAMIISSFLQLILFGYFHKKM